MNYDALANLITQHAEMKVFIEEFVEAWNDGMGGDGGLLMKAREILSKLENRSILDH